MPYHLDVDGIQLISHVHISAVYLVWCMFITIIQCISVCNKATAAQCLLSAYGTCAGQPPTIASDCL
jgi:hypothetical protein